MNACEFSTKSSNQIFSNNLHGPMGLIAFTYPVILFTTRIYIVYFHNGYMYRCVHMCICVCVGGFKLCLKFIKEHQTLCRFLIINLKHSKLCYQDLTMLSQIFKVCSFSLWYQFPLTEIYPNAGIKLPTDWHLRFLGL